MLLNRNGIRRTFLFLILTLAISTLIAGCGGTSAGSYFSKWGDAELSPSSPTFSDGRPYFLIHTPTYHQGDGGSDDYNWIRIEMDLVYPSPLQPVVYVVYREDEEAFLKATPEQLADFNWRWANTVHSDTTDPGHYLDTHFEREDGRAYTIILSTHDTGQYAPFSYDIYTYNSWQPF